MKRDILTVMWKEWKSFLRYSSNRWKGLVILVTPTALFGILFPIQFREGWLTSGWSVGVSFLTPLILIASTISESFAGERERHTLETLLASRLPDRAILFGKLLTSVIFGWAMTLVLLFVSLFVVNAFEWEGTFMFYQPMIFIADISVSLLVSGLVSSLGILVSLKSRTVQNAAQTIMLLLFMPIMLLQALVFLLPTFLPTDLITSFLASIDMEMVLVWSLGTLMLVDIGLFLGAMGRFQRSKLIL